VTLAYLLSTYRPYYTFVINIGDVPSTVDSFSSTDSVITNVTYSTPSAGKALYTVTVNSPAVFGGADYEIIYSLKSNRSFDDRDNDLG
jgi:hypothetical protein